MRTIEVKLYQYNELSDKAKEKAREWWRNVNASDTFWHEFAIDDAKEWLGYLGFSDVKIAFRGFWSQGDGASFTGTWRARDLQVDKASGYGDELKDAIAEFQEIASKYPGASASITRISHHYSHENTVSIECEGFETEMNIDGADVPVVDETRESIFTDFCRDLMRKIYRDLEREYEWQNADEQVEENIRANGYEFTEDGRIA